MSEQRSINNAMWSGVGDDIVSEYRAHALRPVEAAIVEQHRAALSGRVLEIGVGGGRLTELLTGVAAEVHGIDLSPAMVENCRRRFPAGTFEVADLADLSRFAAGRFDALIAGYNVLDVLDEDERLGALDGWRRVLAPGGLLVMSAHNLHYAPRILSPGRVLGGGPRTVLSNLRRRGARVANHKRLAPHERRGDGWAVLNDEGHDHGLLHYYITRDCQQEQLAAAGFELLGCLDLDGRPVGPGEHAEACPELHYVARSVTA